MDAGGALLVACSWLSTCLAERRLVVVGAVADDAELLECCWEGISSVATVSPLFLLDGGIFFTTVSLDELLLFVDELEDMLSILIDIM